MQQRENETHPVGPQRQVVRVPQRQAPSQVPVEREERLITGKGETYRKEQATTSQARYEEQKKLEESRKFYRDIGFSEYGGEYSPFEVPSGYEVSQIEEKPEGLEITFSPKKETETVPTPIPKTRQGRWDELKDFGQDIAHLKQNARTSLTMQILAYGKSHELPYPLAIAGVGDTRGIYGTAGFVSAFEGLINPNVPTIFEAPSQPRGFLAGRITGEAVLILASSKALQPITESVATGAKDVANMVSKATGWKYSSAAYKLSQLKTSILEKLPESPFKYFGKTVSPGEVSIPVSETEQLLARPSTLWATDLGWEMTVAPRTSGVMIPKIPMMAARTRESLPLFFGVGKSFFAFSEVQASESSLGFKRETVARTSKEEYIPKVGGFDRRLPTLTEFIQQQKHLPFATQSFVTRMGLQPYVPSMSTRSSSSFAKLLGFGVAGFGLSIVRPKTQTFEQVNKTLSQIIPKIDYGQRQTRKEALISFPNISARTEAFASVMPASDVTFSVESVSSQIVGQTSIAAQQTVSIPRIVSIPSFSTGKFKFDVPMIPDFGDTFMPRTRRKRKRGKSRMTIGYGEYTYLFPDLAKTFKKGTVNLKGWM
jgi:hypothetical protein